MNIKLFATAAATATATAFLSLPVAAQTLKFGTDGIQFKKDTWLSFTFKEDNGWFNSTLSVYEVLANGSTELKGNLGGETIDGITSYTFTAGKIYTLGLTNYDPTTGAQVGRTIYTSTSLNWAYRNGGVGYQQSIFAQNGSLPVLTDGEAFGDAGLYTQADPLTGTGARIAFEDSGLPFGPDRDYNDFVVQVAPEPITVSGLALGGAGLFAARRRRRSQRKQS